MSIKLAFEYSSLTAHKYKKKLKYRKVKFYETEQILNIIVEYMDLMKSSATIPYFNFIIESSLQKEPLSIYSMDLTLPIMGNIKPNSFITVRISDSSSLDKRFSLVLKAIEDSPTNIRYCELHTRVHEAINSTISVNPVKFLSKRHKPSILSVAETYRKYGLSMSKYNLVLPNGKSLWELALNGDPIPSKTLDVFFTFYEDNVAFENLTYKISKYIFVKHDENLLNIMYPARLKSIDIENMSAMDIKNYLVKVQYTIDEFYTIMCDIFTFNRTDTLSFLIFIPIWHLIHRASKTFPFCSNLVSASLTKPEYMTFARLVVGSLIEGDDLFPRACRICLTDTNKDYTNYTKDYTNYTKDYTEDYTKDYTKDYTEDYTKDYTKNYTKDAVQWLITGCISDSMMREELRSLMTLMLNGEMPNNSLKNIAIALLDNVKILKNYILFEEMEWDDILNIVQYGYVKVVKSQIYAALMTNNIITREQKHSIFWMVKEESKALEYLQSLSNVEFNNAFKISFPNCSNEAVLHHFTTSDRLLLGSIDQVKAESPRALKAQILSPRFEISIKMAHKCVDMKNTELIHIVIPKLSLTEILEVYMYGLSSGFNILKFIRSNTIHKYAEKEWLKRFIPNLDISSYTKDFIERLFDTIKPSKKSAENFFRSNSEYASLAVFYVSEEFINARMDYFENCTPYTVKYSELKAIFWSRYREKVLEFVLNMELTGVSVRLFLEDKDLIHPEYVEKAHSILMNRILAMGIDFKAFIYYASVHVSKNIIDNLDLHSSNKDVRKIVRSLTVGGSRNKRNSADF